MLLSLINSEETVALGNYSEMIPGIDECWENLEITF